MRLVLARMEEDAERALFLVDCMPNTHAHSEPDTLAASFLPRTIALIERAVCSR